LKPNLPERCTTVGDVLGRPEFANAAVREGRLKERDFQYDANTYQRMSDNSKMTIPFLREGEGLNTFAKRRPNELEKVCPEFYEKWICRTSNIPFSLHSISRLRWDGKCPTIASSSSRLIHPREDRPLTVGEIAAMMGWPKGFVPVGENPVAQIGKGVVPATGRWLGEQIKNYLNDYWGDDDFESSYRWQDDEWYGDDCKGKTEKIFRMTDYLPKEAT
jgi:site-specific DNA-cytosine methylase